MSIGPDSLGHPLEFPPEFKQWLADYVALQTPPLPISQVFGFQLQRARTATVDTSETTTSTSYTNLATTGPTLSGLANGWYLLVFGADASGTTASAAPRMSPEINGVAASDADSCSLATLFNDTAALTSNLRVLMVHLNVAGGNNEVVMKYRVAAGTGRFQFRFLHAIKVLTLDE